MSTKSAAKKPVAKPAKPSTALATKATTAPALPVNFMDLLTKHASSDKAAINTIGTSGGSRLSFKGGTISLGGKVLGSRVPIILLKVQQERTYYAGEYNPNVVAVPDCYSYDMVAPHEKAANKQSDTCSGCRHAEWGSDRRGKGKACREGLRAAMVNGYTLTSDDIVAAPMVTAGFSVLNSIDAKAYVGACTEKFGTVAKVLTILGAQADPNRQILNTFTFDEELDKGLLPAVASRLEEAERVLAMPYPDLDASKSPAPAATGKTRKF